MRLGIRLEFRCLESRCLSTKLASYLWVGQDKEWMLRPYVSCWCFNHHGRSMLKEPCFQDNRIQMQTSIAPEEADSMSFPSFWRIVHFCGQSARNHEPRWFLRASNGARRTKEWNMYMCIDMQWHFWCLSIENPGKPGLSALWNRTRVKKEKKRGWNGSCGDGIRDGQEGGTVSEEEVQGGTVRMHPYLGSSGLEYHFCFYLLFLRYLLWLQHPISMETKRFWAEQR